MKLNRRHLYILIPFILAGIASYAQPYPSRLGRFRVDQKRGCVPFTITLTNLLAGDCTAGKPCVMDYEGNNTQQQQLFTYTYTKAGTYKLSVLYQSIGTDDITITVDPNIEPPFEMYACAGGKATIKVVDNNYDQYVIDFNNDGTPESILPYSNNISSPPYTYTPTGTYTAAVRGRKLGAADNCSSKTKNFATINVLPTPRIATLTSVDAANIKLDFAPTSLNVQYRLEIAVNSSTTFQPLQTLYEVNSATVPNLKLDDNYYCFRLGAYDPCNNSSTYSTIVCSTKFTATAVSDINQLRWPTGGTQFATSYLITRNKNPYFNLTNTTSTSFDDTGIICKTDYCYQITVNYSGGSKSISLEKCVKSFSTRIPTAINDVTSVVSTNGVNLLWLQDPKFVPREYLVLRSFPGSALTFVNETTTPEFPDASYTIEGKYCYQINYTDKCDNVSPPGIIDCPMRLRGTLDKTNAITLVWSPATGWQNGVKNYLVEKYDLHGVMIKSTLVTDTVYVDDQPDPINQFVQYRIKAQSKDTGIEPSISNRVDFVKDANLYYPTAFTPNSDNLNDGFIVQGQFIVKINLKIFDRWGVLLFNTDKNEPWDGSLGGKPLPPSTYVWKAEITDLAGRSFSQEGTVVLIRN